MSVYIRSDANTLASFKFKQPIDVALIDGPHGFPFPQLDYYYLYPHMRDGSVLVVDDIQIPHVFDMFKVLSCDDMWSLVDVPLGQTAIFRRTSAPMINPIGDDWWLQAYNRASYRTFFRSDISVGKSHSSPKEIARIIWSTDSLYRSIGDDGAKEKKPP